MSKAKFIQENGETILPITHEEAVLDNDGKNLPSKYQQKQDENLLTDAKTIVGAINELSTKGGSGGGEGTITSVPYTEGSDLDIEQIGGGSIGEITTDDVKFSDGTTVTDAHNGVVAYIEDVEAVAYGNKAKIGETELATTDKTLTGAINELFQSANNGKELIANAIGEPLDASDTFSAMSNDINSLLSTFKTNMMNNGITVESGDKFKSLIDKIATLADNEGKGIQYAEGSINNITLPAYTSGFKQYSINLNIDFTPSILMINIGKFIIETTSTYYTANTTINSLFHNSSSNAVVIMSSTETGMGAGYAYISSSNQLYMSNLRYERSVDLENITYLAIGVGEEDTTLRDSLANILQDAGVEVTEEDDMANLITKVDTELDEATSNKNRLYELMSESGYDVNNSMNLDSLLDLLELSGISASDIKQIACGYDCTFILKTNGSLWSCGNNYYGQLGLNDTTQRTTFTQVTANINNDVKQIACGEYHTIILKTNGTLWGCGLNGSGQLGLGDTNPRYTFERIANNINNDVKEVICGSNHTFILKNDGSLWGCGYNNYYQLGLGNDTNKTSFTKVTANINNDVKQIVCGSNHTFILKTDGSLWGCGYNYNYQLGLSDPASKIYFTQVTTNINNDVKQISCGSNHTFILKTNGSLWSCGNNAYGQLGLNDTTQRTTFTQVTANINNDVKQIACGNGYTMIIKSNNSLWSCGWNGNGQLGLGSTNTQSRFTQVTTNINNDVKEVICGDQHTFILKNNSSILSCGRNNYGQLGFDASDSTIFITIPRGF